MGWLGTETHDSEKSRNSTYSPGKEGCLAREPYPWEQRGEELALGAFNALPLSTDVHVAYHISLHSSPYGEIHSKGCVFCPLPPTPLRPWR